MSLFVWYHGIMTAASEVLPPLIDHSGLTRIYAKVKQTDAIRSGENAPPDVTIFLDVTKLTEEQRAVLADNISDGWLTHGNAGHNAFRAIYPANEVGVINFIDAEIARHAQNRLDEEQLTAARKGIL